MINDFPAPIVCNASEKNARIQKNGVGFEKIDHRIERNRFILASCSSVLVAQTIIPRESTPPPNGRSPRS
jgi:hypothetical protein